MQQNKNFQSDEKQPHKKDVKNTQLKPVGAAVSEARLVETDTTVTQKLRRCVFFSNCDPQNQTNRDRHFLETKELSSFYS